MQSPSQLLAAPASSVARASLRPSANRHSALQLRNSERLFCRALQTINVVEAAFYAENSVLKDDFRRWAPDDIKATDSASFAADIRLYLEPSLTQQIF